MASLNYFDVRVVHSCRPSSNGRHESCPRSRHQGAQLPFAVLVKHDHEIEARLDAPADKVAG
jgi:hypothetical protein